MSDGRICVREVHLAEAGESVASAAQRMLRHNLGTLIVLNDDTEPIGILTDRDLAIKIVAKERPTTTAVREVMSRLPDSVDEDTPIEAALSRMRTGRHRRLPVVDKFGKLVGIVSLDDILELIAEEFRDIGKLISPEGSVAMAEG